MAERRNHNTAIAPGPACEHQWGLVFTIRGGKIARFRHYYDPADITHALS